MHITCSVPIICYFQEASIVHKTDHWSGLPLMAKTMVNNERLEGVLRQISKHSAKTMII